jgi:hypothetical protein
LGSRRFRRQLESILTMVPNEVLTLNPMVLTAVLLMGVAMVALPRKFALFPLFIVAAFVTLGQVVVIAGANFTMVRILILFGLIRMIVRNDYLSIRLNNLDKVMIVWAVSSIVTYTILWQSGHAFINRLGMCFDTVGVFFLCKLYLADTHDIRRILILCALLLVPLAAFMIYEFLTGKNLFSFLGGIPVLSEVRNGHVRCQGSFRHPILMGTFGATMLPLILSLWWDRGTSKIVTVLGATSCLIIVGCSGSSGAVMAAAYGIAGLLFWFLRDHMRIVRWSIVLVIVVLQLFMKAPIWWILSRLSGIMGGTGWHRAFLIDQAIRYFNEWWLIGTKVTSHWMPSGLAIDPTNSDITNQYLFQGVNGGLVTMALFLLIIIFGFKTIGTALRFHNFEDISGKILIWTMGVSLFAHVLSFVSVTYFDQIQVFWYFLMAAISVSSEAAVLYAASRQGAGNQEKTKDVIRQVPRSGYKGLTGRTV